MSIRRTAIVGSGGWGTALAVLWSKQGNEITLWGHDHERAERVRSTRENAEYLPGVKLPESISITSDIRGFTFKLAAKANSNYIIEVSSNLINWTPIKTNKDSFGFIDFTDPFKSSVQTRFYRTRKP